jgi:biotin synthase
MPADRSAQEAVEIHESPQYVRVSLAAAMTMGFVNGWFHRNAKLGCVNLLMSYEAGCRANCAFCGLARERRDMWRSRKFIRVAWKTYSLERILAALTDHPSHVERVCVSMITHPRCVDDALEICRTIRARSDLPVSLLIAPSVLKRDDLYRMRDAGADKIGVAIDAATPELFSKFRGRGVRGPHDWDRYWRTFSDCLDVFGSGMAGVHLIVGLGETEQEMTSAIDRAKSLGGGTHLFSFFPEAGSAMADHPQPPMGTYRRIQLARWLIDHDLARSVDMEFDAQGRLADYGVSRAALEAAISSGEPFRTSGCTGPSGKVACNRPYGNEKPGAAIRNFPFPPTEDDMREIRTQLLDYETRAG